MLQIGDWNVSGEIVAAIVVAISWICAAISTAVTKDDDAFGVALVFSILVGIGYLLLKS